MHKLLVLHNRLCYNIIIGSLSVRKYQKKGILLSIVSKVSVERKIEIMGIVENAIEVLKKEGIRVTEVEELPSFSFYDVCRPEYCLTLARSSRRKKPAHAYIREGSEIISFDYREDVILM